MNELDLTFVDEAVDKIGTGREKVLEILQAVQRHFGYLPQEALERVCELTDITAASIAGVSTFYSQFRHRPAGRHIIRLCVGTACHVKGGEQILITAKQRLGVDTGETTADGEYDLDRVACLGCCALAPVVAIDDKVHSQMSVLKIQRLLDEQKND